QTKSWILPEKYVWTDMSGTSKSELEIPLAEVRKRFPNFMHTDGFLTAPYKVSIYIGGGNYIDNIIVLSKKVYTDKMYTLNSSIGVSSGTVTSEKMILTLTESTKYIKVFITEG